MQDDASKAVLSIAEHVRNAQVDIDWLKDQFSMLRAGVQGVVDEQHRRDQRAETMLLLMATTSERMRILTWLAVVPSAIVMLCGALVLVRQVLGLLSTQHAQVALAMIGIAP